MVLDVKVLVGLGNPGEKYRVTRHNLGFLFLDYIYDRHAEVVTGWKESYDAQIAEVVMVCARAGGGSKRVKLILCKPQTYMNCSGEPLQKLLRFYKHTAEDFIVAHDEADLPFGVQRLKKGGGEAGHNGLRSISRSQGTKDYLRLRLGVGKPEGEEARVPLADWLLRKFSEEQLQKLPDMHEQAVDFLKMCFVEGVEAARNKFHSDAQ